MIALISISLYLLGISMMSQSASQQAAVSYEETYGNRTIYYTGEFLSDPIFYHYREESNTSELDRFKIFMSMLIDSEAFSFVSTMKQPLQVIETEIPDVFLNNYEDGMSSSSKSDIEGKPSYLTKSITVTQSFFDAFSMKLKAGRSFTDEDFCFDFHKKTDIPVILGNEYQSVFQIGDRFDAYYVGEPFHFVVVGILDANSFFFNRNNADMASCDRYMLLPAFYTNSYDDFSRIMTLQHIHGVIFSSIGYEETVSLFQKYQHDADLSHWELYCSYPNDKNEKTNVFQMYSAMTGEVSRQFRIIVVLVLLFDNIAIITMICSILRENRLNFGIEMLCGSSRKQISMQAFLMSGFLVLAGDLLSFPFILLGNIGIRAFLTVQLAAVFITAVIGTICTAYTYSQLSELYGLDRQALLDAVTAEHDLIQKFTASGRVWHRKDLLTNFI